MTDEDVIYTDGHRSVYRGDERGAGGAPTFYKVYRPSNDEEEDREGNPLQILAIVEFQPDAIPVVGVKGLTNEALLAIVIDRLEGFQWGSFACDANRRALEGCRVALNSLEERTAERKLRGVEGKHEA